ncbi:hypothetical protein GRI58_01665 [Porphyrobacter algicida]|uniref:DUF2946 domain-containing protein n=1 Tax=Qipengyuania algicida TaxID=1836209 RepID=A0A845ADH2_9SPHN|nr:hypothetical protein [Qipengyuania algicida]MXP27527.1 hypothetical protein [Qipengyuania algicida]
MATRPRHPFRSGLRLPVLLLASIFLLRALVPAGWMPVAGPHGLSLAVCDGMGPQAAMANMGMASHGDRDHPAPSSDHSQICHFASLSLALDKGGTPPALPAPKWLTRPPPGLVQTPASPQRVARALPPPQTGPPVIERA